MEVKFHPYQKTNRIKGQEVNATGYLFKFKFNENNIGYGSYHPHPLLGDKEVNHKSPLFFQRLPIYVRKNLLYWASVDAKARRVKQDLLSGLSIKTHVFVKNLDKIESVMSQSLDKSPNIKIDFKIKLNGTNYKSILEQLNKVKNLSRINFKFDANESLSFDEALYFWDNFEHKSQVLCFEDPCLFNFEEWKKLCEDKMPVFLDFAHAEVSNEVLAECTKGFVLKLNGNKSQQDLKDIISTKKSYRFFVTHSMDHILGQRTAAYLAQNLSDTFPENVLSHGIDLESLELSIDLPEIGFGLSEEFERLDWQAILG